MNGRLAPRQRSPFVSVEPSQLERSILENRRELYFVQRQEWPALQQVQLTDPCGARALGGGRLELRQSDAPARAHRRLRLEAAMLCAMASACGASARSLPDGCVQPVPQCIFRAARFSRRAPRPCARFRIEPDWRVPLSLTGQTGRPPASPVSTSLERRSSTSSIACRTAAASVSR